MTVRVVLEDTGLGLRAAVLDDGHLVEIRDADFVETRITDALFAARVTAVDPKLNAAFLDCGLAQPGMIVAKDARAAAGSAERRPIRDLLREGQRLIVQGLREPVDDKGARFTSDVRLIGMALVHTPLAAGREAGGQGGGRRQGEALRERGFALFPDGRFALRRHAAALEDAALRAEASELAERWAAIESVGRNAKPGRLPDREGPLARLLRALIDLEPVTIAAADPLLLLELERLRDRNPALAGLDIVRLQPDEAAFAQTGVDAAIEQALAVDVPLKGGGRLRIEPTAACVAIDVDSAGRPPLEADLAAVPEIARQVRLRNLGGSIVIDFIDLPTKPERQRLEDALKRAFRGDPVPVDIHPMSPLGIVQISRARRGEPLAERFLAPCACCGGDGRGPSARAGAEALIGILRRMAHPADTIAVSPDLAEFLDGTGRDAWAHVVGRLGREPRRRVDPVLPQGGYRLDGRPHGG